MKIIIKLQQVKNKLNNIISNREESTKLLPKITTINKDGIAIKGEIQALINTGILLVSFREEVSYTEKKEAITLLHYHFIGDYYHLMESLDNIINNDDIDLVTFNFSLTENKMISLKLTLTYGNN